MAVQERFAHRFHRESFREKVEKYSTDGLREFKKIVYSHLFFHLSFFSLLAIAFLGFLLSLTLFFNPSMIALFLSILLITGFVYFTLLFYFQTKKPEQLLQLRNWFISLCKQGLPPTNDLSEYHLSLANAAYSFASHLGTDPSHLSQHSNRYSYLLHRLLQRGAEMYYKKNIDQMKELLMFTSINQHIELIKECPTQVEVHASLANTYIALSHLYRGKGQTPSSKEQVSKFHSSIKKAIQEFQIINDYSPNDPWVYAQLASCYHDLQLYEEEITTYEAILKLCPNDKEILFRLGILYFQQNNNGKGLRIYEKLRKLGFSKADQLLDFYGAEMQEGALPFEACDFPSKGELAL